MRDMFYHNFLLTRTTAQHMYKHLPLLSPGQSVKSAIQPILFFLEKFCIFAQGVHEWRLTCCLHNDCRAKVEITYTANAGL